MTMSSEHKRNNTIAAAAAATQRGPSTVSTANIVVDAAETPRPLPPPLSAAEGDK